MKERGKFKKFIARLVNRTRDMFYYLTSRGMIDKVWVAVKE